MSTLVSVSSGEVIMGGLTICSTFLSRLTGYLVEINRYSPGLFFLNTRKVHTIGMGFPLDLYFFSGSMSLLGTSPAVGPMRFPESPLETRHILEVPHYTHKSRLAIEIGEQVSIFQSSKK